MQEEIVIPVAFFMTICGVIWLRSWRTITSERERQQTIRLAIERGQQLDAALVEKMLAPPNPKLPANPYTVPLGFLAAGVGLAVLGLFLRQVGGDDAFWPVAGAGCMVAILGAGLFLAVMLQQRNQRQLPLA